jgi:flagellar biosynthesis protein FlhB
MADHDQRTEQPTQRRVQKAREQGQFLSARDFVGAVQFTAATALIVFLGSGWLTSTQRMFSMMLRSAFNRELDAPRSLSLFSSKSACRSPPRELFSPGFRSPRSYR